MEGPEAGVYYRGTAKINVGFTFTEIYLADYVDKLAREFTVYVTPVANFNDNIRMIPTLITSRVQDGKFSVYSNVIPCEFDYLVMGKRLAIEVEREKALVTVKGAGPYKWI
jgi:hypothetical protein